MSENEKKRRGWVASAHPKVGVIFYINYKTLKCFRLSEIITCKKLLWRLGEKTGGCEIGIRVKARRSVRRQS